MKKIVALLLMSVMMLALTGCGGSAKRMKRHAGSDKKVVLEAEPCIFSRLSSCTNPWNWLLNVSRRKPMAV